MKTKAFETMNTQQDQNLKRFLKRLESKIQRFQYDKITHRIIKKLTPKLQKIEPIGFSLDYDFICPYS
jgi:hypothetical protein